MAKIGPQAACRGWHLGPNDQVFAGDFNGDGKADLFIRNGGWAGLLVSTGSGFSNVWMSGDPAQNQNWIGGWHLGPNDQVCGGRRCPLRLRRRVRRRHEGTHLGVLVSRPVH
jgi:hypothetical protein